MAAGSIRERRPGVWELRAFLGRDPVSGKPRQKSKTFKGTKREADKALARLVTESVAHRTVPTTDTFGHLLDRWLAELEREDRSPLYVANATAAVEKRIRPQLGSIKLPALTAERLDRFYGDMRKEGLADSTTRLYANYIKSALSLAVRWEWLDRSPAKRSKPPAWPDRTVPPPSVEQVVRLIEAAKEKRRGDMAALLFVAAATGMRRGELCGLRWSDIDFEMGALTINRSAVRAGGKVDTKPPKSGKARRLALDRAMLEVLAAQRAWCETLWPLGADAYVWSYRWGNAEPLVPGSVTTWFMKLRDECGLPHVRLHDLRHFSVTTLLTAGVDVRTVSGRHGHASATMTLERYGHFMQSADVVAASIMGQLLRPPELEC